MILLAKKDLTQTLRNLTEAKPARSAWDKGVKAYALELIDSLEEAIEYENHAPATVEELKLWMLNGAKDWNQYSWSGGSLIYDYDIAARLCTSSELKRTKDGERRPNRDEEWLDVQARALYQAARHIAWLARFVC